MSEGLFQDDDLIRIVAREGILIAGGGAASLLQTAHPKVAQGVYDHSYTAADPLRRLRHTMGWLYAVQFGTRQEAERLSALVRRGHDRIAGPGYQANDPELQVWVAATLFSVGTQLYQCIFRRTFDHGELEQLYRQSKIYATILGCPKERLPSGYRDFREYYAEMLRTLRVSDASRKVAAQVLYPGLPRSLEPAMGILRLITTGFMPEPIREQYGWKWNPSRERRFRLLMDTLSLAYPRLPLPVRTLPRDRYLRATRRMLAGAPSPSPVG